MNYQRDPWQQYSYDLEKFEREIKELTYTGAFSPPPDPYARDYLTRDIPVGGITLEQIADICAAAAVGTLHGLELLRPVDLPKFPKVPARPSGQPNQYQEWISEKGENLSAKLASIRQTFQGALVEEAGILEQLKTACESGQPEAVILLMKISYFRHLLPRILMLEPNFSYDFGSKIILANIEIPAFSRLRVVKKRGNFSTAKWLPVSAIEPGLFNAHQSPTFGVAV